jgi:6-phosphogluconate dehydrogenase
MMIPAGKPVDKAIQSVKPYLKKGEICIDIRRFCGGKKQRQVNHLVILIPDEAAQKGTGRWRAALFFKDFRKNCYV